MPVLTSMYGPRAPSLDAVEKEGKTLCNEVELCEMGEVAKKTEEPLYPVICLAQFISTLTPHLLFKIVPISVLGRGQLSSYSTRRLLLRPLSHPEEDFNPSHHLAWTFRSYQSNRLFFRTSPTKIISSPASPDDLPALHQEPTINSTNDIRQVAPSPSNERAYSP